MLAATSRRSRRMRVSILSYTTSDGIKHVLQPPIVIEENIAVSVPKTKANHVEFIKTDKASYIDTGVTLERKLNKNEN